MRRLTAILTALAVGLTTLLAASLLTAPAASAAVPKTTKINVVKNDASWRAEVEWRPLDVSLNGTVADACRFNRTGSVRVVFTFRVINSKDPVTMLQTKKACRTRDYLVFSNSPRYGQKVTAMRVQVCNMDRGKAVTCASKLFDNPTV